jgi:hypothetical protein
MLARRVLYGWDGLPNPFTAAGKSKKQKTEKAAGKE